MGRNSLRTYHGAGSVRQRVGSDQATSTPVPGSRGFTSCNPPGTGSLGDSSRPICAYGSPNNSQGSEATNQNRQAPTRSWVFTRAAPESPSQTVAQVCGQDGHAVPGPCSYSSWAWEYLPAIPDIHARLPASPGMGRRHRLGPGGWSSISLAMPYPGIHVDGYEMDEASTFLAWANAHSAA